MTEEQFNIRMEKMDDHTSDSKYAIIGFFEEKQRKQNELISRAASAADPEAAQEVPTVVRNTPTAVRNIPPVSLKRQSNQQNNMDPVATPIKVRYTLSNILSDSTAEQWLLALIAFLLFINIICKS